MTGRLSDAAVNSFICCSQWCFNWRKNEVQLQEAPTGRGTATLTPMTPIEQLLEKERTKREKDQERSWRTNIRQLLMNDDTRLRWLTVLLEEIAVDKAESRWDENSDVKVCIQGLAEELGIYSFPSCRDGESDDDENRSMASTVTSSRTSTRYLKVTDSRLIDKHPDCAEKDLLHIQEFGDDLEELIQNCSEFTCAYLANSDEDVRNVLVKRIPVGKCETFQRTKDELYKTGLSHRILEPLCILKDPWQADEVRLMLFPKISSGRKKSVLGERSLTTFVKSMVSDKSTAHKDPFVPGKASILVVRDLLRTVDRFHRCGVIHRKLNPDNVWVNRELQICIKGLEECGSEKYGVPGAETLQMSTRAHSYEPLREDSKFLNYMPPETHQGCESKIHPWRPDQWACGMMIHFILSGGVEPQFPKSMIDFNSMDVSIPSLSPLARDLVLRLTYFDPSEYGIQEARSHPMLWEPSYRMIFLRQVSDFFELIRPGHSIDDAEAAGLGLSTDCAFNEAKVKLAELFKFKLQAGWSDKLDSDLMDWLRQKKHYDDRDPTALVRAVRNADHFETMPHPLKRRLQIFEHDTHFNGLLQYFDAIFPHLFLGCYKFVETYQVKRILPNQDDRDERLLCHLNHFSKYFPRKAAAASESGGSLVGRSLSVL